MSVALSQRNDDDDPSGNGNPWGVNACPHIAKRRKDMFGDCALIEIIHLHDCLRGALQALQQDVGALRSAMQKKSSRLDLSSLECKANGRFKVIWSVFRAHSSAEDEFIWPALRLKTQGRVKGSPKYVPNQPPETDSSTSSPPTTGDSSTTTSTPNSPAAPTASQEQEDDAVVDQESYEEDHASEERMFEVVDKLLTQLRDRLHTADTASSGGAESSAPTKGVHVSLEDLMNSVHDLTCSLSEHLMVHLDREEMQCLPLVVKHLSKSEITDLVGQIMGKRSSDIMSGIMTMAVQSLEQDERHEMVRYMKQAMAGTFFDKWLSMSGWMDDPVELVRKREAPAADSEASTKRVKVEKSVPTTTGTGATESSSAPPDVSKFSMGEITSQTELERLIRAIVTNPTLTPQQKNTTIQGLRDSVWKTNQRIKDLSGTANAEAETNNNAPTEMTSTVTKSGILPTAHFAKAPDGTVEEASSEDMPKFSSREMNPTYHDGTGGAVLGCPHYARSCKLRHPLSGRLHTCRLCCEQDREMPDGDEPLDRYAVTEVLCMKCNALQPVGEKCINPKCSSHDKPFANYYCNICHLYDDRPRPIFHCPYCNTCRMGQGLGIDFRHCMRCNACVALSDSDHRCIPQKLQGTCPICSESLFQSTEPLRGLKCGHVMHLSCFTEYRRTQRYTCPLCMKSVEDMSEYFALLDEAVRLQPMPPGFSSTFCTIYCQDCEATGDCSYHFVGLKCQHCGSYNTRELSRTHRLNTL